MATSMSITMPIAMTAAVINITIRIIHIIGIICMGNVAAIITILIHVTMPMAMATKGVVYNVNGHHDEGVGADDGSDGASAAFGYWLLQMAMY